MEVIKNWQIKAIFALGRELGIVESGSHEDNLHMLVASLTAKESIKKLSSAEANTVIADLRHKLRFGDRSASGNLKMSKEQYKKIWALMYKLKSHDITDSDISLDDRLRGIVKKVLQRDPAKNPLYGLSKTEAGKVIEEIKKYCRSAKRRNSAGGAAYESTG